MAQFDAPDYPELHELLEHQRGIVSAAQLAALGVTREFTRIRVDANGWQRLHRGVYAVFSGPLDRLATIWSALLRCGQEAVASHETAAELYNLDIARDERIHVTVPAHSRVGGSRSGIVVHHAHRLAQTRHPTLSPPRTRVEDTVLDLADAARTARAAGRGMISAIQRRLTTPARLVTALNSRKKISWRRMLMAMVADIEHGAQSPLEIEHLRSVERAHGLPPGQRQHRVNGARVTWVDVSYSEFATRVELDGRVGHIGDGAFRDRQRDNRGTVDRFWTLRYGYAEVVGSPCEVAAEQARVLQQRGWTGEPHPCGPGCTLPMIMSSLSAIA